MMSDDSSEILSRSDLDALVDEHVQNGEYKTAVFWAEKRLALCSGWPAHKRYPEIARYLNVLTIAQCWQPVVSYCSRHDLHLKHVVFQYFYVNASFQLKNFVQVAQLGTAIFNVDVESNSTTAPYFQQLDEMAKERKIESRLMLVLSKAYLAMNNRPAAKNCIKESLQRNPNSSDALQTAIDFKLLSDKELKKLIASIHHKGKKSTGGKVMSLIYELRCSKNEPSDLQVYNTLANDVSVQSAMAVKLYNKGNISEAFQITSGILSELGYYDNCILVHIASLVSLKKKNALFALSHQLVDSQPDSHITWYAVGCYYYTVNQFSTAKKFLDKATTMNNGFGEGWMAYGHVLFYSEEHEQAMNCFLRASRVLEGNFEPLLYIALEHSFANSFKLAGEFMRDADAIEPNNPIVSHEEATIAYLQQNYTKAEQTFRKAIRQVCKASPRENFSTTLSRPCSDFWEPMFQNMGHCLRRMRRYDEAIEVFRKALALGKNKSQAWANIGVCYGCLGRLNEGIEALNEAIIMNPGDEYVERALRMLIDQSAKLPLDDILEPVSAAEENEENMDFLADDSIRGLDVDSDMMDVSDDRTAQKLLIHSTTPMRTRSQTNR
ncbi:unnamed protein product [Bursaphelenchus okinawaensis]|uniref:TPR_REGION domain-containing protein n=1 Tax=Bursaphelenchus okinawaensis TaxID=465554 RepID=A0A811LP25_9BILA|nr:unnamed protein product [Bursaphelenchus okinawaensis]CAG9125260.1 unnamed protein product [Bursaphelenchus okinawaensis]